MHEGRHLVLGVGSWVRLGFVVSVEGLLLGCQVCFVCSVLVFVLLVLYGICLYCVC